LESNSQNAVIVDAPIFPIFTFNIAVDRPPGRIPTRARCCDCDTWQLVINTSTTIVTFLMVFLIQNTQNRDTLAIQLKLSELVLAMKGAENKFAAIEDLSDEELEQLHNDCRARADMTRRHIEGRKAGSKPRSKTPASGRRPS
jgi:low affinity Fe/Cu permease